MFGGKVLKAFVHTDSLTCVHGKKKLTWLYFFSGSVTTTNASSVGRSCLDINSRMFGAQLSFLPLWFISRDSNLPLRLSHADKYTHSHQIFVVLITKDHHILRMVKMYITFMYNDTCYTSSQILRGNKQISR